MTLEIDVAFLPEHVSSKSLKGCVAVVIDVLRASTTITTALAHGVKCVIPFETPKEAVTHRENLKTTRRVLLGGERNGVVIEGFDLDNSPWSYDSKTVSGCTVLFTTTNGTKALMKAETDDEILVGSFVNLSAVTRHLLARRKHVRFVCAGTDGEVSAEDLLCAGAMIEKLMQTLSDNLRFSNTAEIARTRYWRYLKENKGLYHTLKASKGGNNLFKLGFERDIAFASKIDLFDIVPRFSRRTGRIEPIPPTR